MFMDMVTDDVLQEFAADTGERNGAIVSALLVFPFLKTGDTCAFFQSSGRTPSRSECWKMSVRIGASSGTASFRVRQGMLSGPVALFALMLLRSFWTPLMFTWMLPIGGKLGPYGVGMSEDFSLVKDRFELVVQDFCFRSAISKQFPLGLQRCNSNVFSSLGADEFPKRFGVRFLEG